MVGIRRYVHIAFVIIGLVLAFFLSNIFSWIGGAVGSSGSILGFDLWSVLAVAVSFLVAFLLWRSPTVFGFAEEVADEIKKVTWPTLEETKSATWVVIAMVAIFSVALGIYDFLVHGLINSVVAFLS
jgi:preprotein translocase subunit SecE